MAVDFSRVFEILDYQKENFPQEDALAAKVNGQWQKISTDAYMQKAGEMALGLMKLGIGKDDKVATVTANRPEWNYTDMGVQQLGAITVPLYPTITVEDYRYILEHSESKVVFAETEELYGKIKEAVKDNPNIIGIYTYDQVEGASHWTEISHAGAGEDRQKLQAYRDAVTPEDVLTIIYTSGTTGRPKGVMLTHNNLVSNVKSCTPLMPVDHSSRALSFLPLCHVYERMLNYLYLSNGVSVYYAENMDTIADNLKEIHPQIFVTVPRLLEKVYDKIVAKGAEQSGIKKALFFWALKLGHRYEINKNQGFFYNLQLKLANKLIFKKWREALGGQIEVIVSGGAALQPRLAKVFSAANIIILEGYGLTETSPVIAVNRVEPENRRIGTVGPPIPGVEVEIAEDGEILSRGPHIMKGYYKMEALTKEAIDEHNWFHTGDMGTFAENKFLKITGRKKEIFKTSGGKYIAPENMENKFKESKFIEQMMVVGEGRKFPAALIVPAFNYLEEWAKLHDISFHDKQDLIEKQEVYDRIWEEVEHYNENFAQYAKVKKIKILPQEWTIEEGELTPTLKLKRKQVFEKYQYLIEGIYNE